MFKIHTEIGVTQFTHTPQIFKQLPNLPVDPFEVSVDVTFITAAFCGQTTFSMFDGEYLVTIHAGSGHGLSWRIIVQKSDSVSEDFGWGWLRKNDDDAANHLVESFSNALPEGLRSQARSLLEKIGLVSKDYEVVDIG